MRLTDIVGTGCYGRGNDDKGYHDQSHRRRRFTLSGSVLVAGAIVFSPLFTSQATASSPAAVDAGALGAAAGVSNYSGTQSATPLPVHSATSLVTRPGSSEYRRGYRKGFREGRRDGWVDGKRLCRWEGHRTRDYLAADGDYDRGYGDGFERGYELGFKLALKRYC